MLASFENVNKIGITVNGDCGFWLVGFMIMNALVEE